MGTNWIDLGLWDIENATVPSYELPEDFLPALPNFVTSFGFNGDALLLDCYAGDENDASRGILAAVFREIKKDQAVSVFSCPKDPRTGKVPKQAADREIRKRLDILHKHKYGGLVVIIAGDGGYTKKLEAIEKAGKLKIIRIYPYGHTKSVHER